ncbi:PAAR domain-containing protein [Enterobacter cloacae complex sp. ECC445]|uniref:PAAR domain-containing protein n=1 Tax=Enterobacter cloacae complex sp. ECC445 TaxID=2913213 RepID=UPI001F3D169E|nr:PAAR domain-containing protein [Enterobacter cloacae complex sp. ECC445]MCG0454784.1 PAAR domain-containing protein [Enterobacter cloacae complex sp. ECC445]
MAIGFWVVKGDKTTCGGSVLTGHPKGKQIGPNLNRQATVGCQVSCGKHPGIFSVVGGYPGEYIHGQLAASTIYSRSTCPCKAFFIATHTFMKHGPYQEPVRATSAPLETKAVSDPVQEPEQHAQVAKKQNSFADTCKPEENPLLNGVYIWTETKNAGHAFVSVHQNNNVYLYTYGRYGRTNRGGFTGDGILNFLQDEDARVYYRSELYEMGARVFRIEDADPVKTRAFFENLWNSSKPSFQTSNMKATTRRRGHTIDGYDVTGRNCTTHSVEGIKFAGSRVFEHGYTSKTTQLPIDAEEDFTIPVSLQRFIITKGGDMSSMLVVEMTNTFKKQFPTSGNLQPFQETPGGKFQHLVADTAAIGDSLSPYSGGTVGGVLGGSYDNDE